MLDATEWALLAKIADMHGTPQGAYNIRKNGVGVERRSTENISISTKADKPGIDVVVKPGTKNESIHIPVILTSVGISDTVYNDFVIGADSEVVIVAGCGIHSPGPGAARHDGIHSFAVGPRTHMKYIERHYGEGSEESIRTLNPVTIIEAERDSTVELEMTQIGGIESALRDTKVVLHENAKLILVERVLTRGSQKASSQITIEMDGDGASAQVVSRSVARDSSGQEYRFDLLGKAACKGHIQCDAIVMDSAHVSSSPMIDARDSRAQLIHEAAIGRIESEQLLKLESLGLTEKQAESRIIEGFLA